MRDAPSKRPRLMTVAAFLDWPGDGTGCGSQLVDGELRPWRPGTQTHGTIKSTLNALIFIALSDAGNLCRVVSAPGMVIEILSPSNATDTWDNVCAYTTIPSVREIVVVHSIHVEAELLRRSADGGWPGRSQQDRRRRRAAA